MYSNADSMVAYSMLDVVDEKERLVAKANNIPSDPFKSFLGLLQETITYFHLISTLIIVFVI